MRDGGNGAGCPKGTPESGPHTCVPHEILAFATPPYIYFSMKYLVSTNFS
jgi:hypothetical protein